MYQIYYKPIAILPTISKIFGRIFNQLQRFSNKFLSSLLYGLKRVHCSINLYKASPKMAKMP